MSGKDNSLDVAVKQLDQVAERINLDPSIHRPETGKKLYRLRAHPAG